MKKHKQIRKDAELLVEHILDKDPISANSVFQRLIMEAEEAREEEVANELGLDGDTEDIESETDEVTEFDESDEAASDIESMDNTESDNIVDDIVEINCQINAKMVSNLFDKIAGLKNAVQSLGLDENSREYLKYDVTIQYYSDKLQDLQNKTNPGIDQSKVEAALEKISVAIEQLEGEVGYSGETDGIENISTPEEVAAENELTDSDTDSIEAETESEEDTEEDTEENEETPEETEVSDEEEIDELFG